MKQMFYGGIAATLLFGTAVFAQTSQPRAQTQPEPRTQTGRASTDEHVTVIGCVQREEDYRRAHNMPRGGAVGTGVGAANEFVLVNAMMSGRPTGTAGRAASETEFELTGSAEGKLTEHVGKRVEITGNLKAAEVGASGQPTGGATAGRPPQGVDVTSEDLKLRELEVLSVKTASGNCAPTR
jgi:hypothetical protein